MGNNRLKIKVDSLPELPLQQITEGESYADAVSSLSFPAIGGQFTNYFRASVPALPEASDYTGNLYEYVAHNSKLKRSENKISTSRSYNFLKNELGEFYGSENIPWKRVSETFVLNFAEWLKHKGYKDSTQVYYLTMLRTLLFKAKNEGFCNATSEWFKPVKTTVTSKTVISKKPFDIKLMKKIARLNLKDNDRLALVRDMFMFAFYCRGMELVDVAHLTKENIQGDTLVYNKRLVGKEVKVTLQKDAMEILNGYEDSEKYLFPLLERGRATLFATHRYWVSTQLKEVGKMIGYPELTFINNIDAWKSLIAETNIIDRLMH